MSIAVDYRPGLKIKAKHLREKIEDLERSLELSERQGKRADPYVKASLKGARIDLIHLEEEIAFIGAALNGQRA